MPESYPADRAPEADRPDPLRELLEAAIARGGPPDFLRWAAELLADEGATGLADPPAAAPPSGERRREAGA